MLARNRRLWLVAGCLVAGGIGCTDEVVVVRERFADPPAAAQGFLGYADQGEGRPVCGTCHVGKYGEWRETRHAGAWGSLQGSGHASETCEGCHSVGARGNLVVDLDVGWSSTGDPRYQDVQCESCHGPGLQHVTNPDASQPLASIEVGPDLESGCGECHSGSHNPFVEEWAASRHGKRNTYPQGRADCGECHEARGIFAAWGIRAEYLEKEGTDPLPVTCAVCHDPHDARNPRQLRFPIDVPHVETNLCMKCHHKRAQPDLAAPSRGAHSPQGPLLIGEDAGWIPPSFSFPATAVIATHGTERNARLCAGCHVTRLEVTDALTGDFVFNASGHLFKAIPCLDAQGVPTASDDCEIDQRSFRSCAVSGCHGSEGAARNVLTIVRNRISALVGDLNALLARVPATEFSDGDGRLSTAEGAKFNAGLAAQAGSPIHNPFLIEALLTASIRQVMLDYDLSNTSGIVLENVLGAGADSGSR